MTKQHAAIDGGVEPITKTKILSVFAELNGKPNPYGDPMQHPIFFWLGKMGRKHGDALREPLQAAIAETEHRAAAILGVMYHAVLPGDNVSYLADTAVNDSDDWLRDAAVGALESLDERGVLGDLYSRVPAVDRDSVGRTLVCMDAASLGAPGGLSSLLVQGRHPGEHPGKCWAESVDIVGKTKSLEIVAMARDHPQLPESVRPAVCAIYEDLAHD